jgi:hypothetical protein
MRFSRVRLTVRTMMIAVAAAAVVLAVESPGCITWLCLMRWCITPISKKDVTERPGRVTYMLRSEGCGRAIAAVIHSYRRSYHLLIPAGARPPPSLSREWGTRARRRSYRRPKRALVGSVRSTP